MTDWEAQQQLEERQRVEYLTTNDLNEAERRELDAWLELINHNERKQ